MQIECPHCEGSGYEYDECETCGRNGWVEDEENGGTMTCPDCEGESSTQCEECEGDGEVYREDEDDEDETDEEDEEDY